MTVLDKALALAMQGYPVFPCGESKRPTCEGGFHAATTDPVTIARLFSNPAAVLIGVPTGAASGISVLDIDPLGWDWHRDNAGMLSETRAHRTRRNGLHLLFKHQDDIRNSASKIAPGVDVRGEGGYIVWWPAAGHGILRPDTLAPMPDDLVKLATRRTERQATDMRVRGTAKVIPAGGIDTYVADLLASVETAEEGRKHERLRNAALALGGAIHLLDWTPEEAADRLMAALPGTVEDIDQAHGTAMWGLQVGAASPVVQSEFVVPEFDALPPEPPAKVIERPGGGLVLAPYRLRPAAAIPPRQWLYRRHLIRGYLSATVAPGGLGKSSLLVAEAVDMATGRGLFTGGRQAPPLRVFYWCGEDPFDEIERRVAAVCKLYGINEADVDNRLILASGRDMPLRLVTGTQGGPTINEPLVADLIAEIQRNRVDVMILDPFVSVHTCGENDNTAINLVADVFRRIADRTRTAIELVHHTRKAGSGQSGQDRVADDARGAGALIAAARSVRVLNPMSSTEGNTLGIPDSERWQFFRADNGKANLAPPGKAEWFRKVDVDLENGQGAAHPDRVGVVERWEQPAPDHGITPEQVQEFLGRLSGGGRNRRSEQSHDWAGHELADVLGWDSHAARGRLRTIIGSLTAKGRVVTSDGKNSNGRATPVLIPGPGWFVAA